MWWSHAGLLLVSPPRCAPSTTRFRGPIAQAGEPHAAAVALRFCWYNFVRVHQTLRVTPAMEAGITDHVGSVADLVSLVL
jgi:hypothetical protein